MPEGKDYLSIGEVAKLLGLKYHHVRKLLIEDSELACHKYGRKRVWKLDDILAFQKRHFIAA